MKLTAILAGSLLALALPSQAAILLGVTSGNELVEFDTSAPSSFLSSVAITGLKAVDGVTNDPGAVLLNLAYNPANGQHYGVDSNANFYSIARSGAASIIDNTFAPAGFDAGFDYDPFSGGFLFASDAAENVIIGVNGARTTNPALAFAAGDPNASFTPAIFGVGIDPDFGTTYMIDGTLDVLVTSVDPNFSEIFTIGSLGINVSSFGGLTVDGDGILWGALSTDGLTSSLYTFNTTTGAAAPAGSFGGAGINAIAAVPEPSRAVLGLIGLAGLVFRRRR